MQQPAGKTIGRILGENLVACVVVLLLIGLFMVLDATSAKGDIGGHLSEYFVKQLTWDVLGILCATVVILFVPVSLVHRLAPWLGGLSFVLLAAVLVVGASINGAKRWFRVGPMSFQPSEFAKLAILLFFAWFLERNKELLRTWKGALTCIGFAFVVAGIIAVEPDLGNAVLLFFVLLGMMYVAGVRMYHLFVTVASCLPLPVLVLYNHFDHIKARVMLFLDPSLDPAGKGYQSQQALIAIGSGGLFGNGPGRGMQKFSYLPEAHNDFIFAIVGEDFGLFGCGIVLCIYALLLWCAFRICRKTTDLFTLLTAFGVTALFTGQTLFNLSVVTGLVPNKGISLPLISYGGSNVLFALIALGLLVKISISLPPDRPLELGAIRTRTEKKPLF